MQVLHYFVTYSYLLHFAFLLLIHMKINLLLEAAPAIIGYFNFRSNLQKIKFHTTYTLVYSSRDANIIIRGDITHMLVHLYLIYQKDELGLLVEIIMIE